MTIDFQARLDAIAASASADACIIFLRQEDGTLEPHARFGAASTPAIAAVESALAHRAIRDALPAKEEFAGCTVLAVPVVSVTHALGAVTLRRSAAAPFTIEETSRLRAIAAEILTAVERARLLDAIDSGVPSSKRPGGPRPEGERILKGLAASPGISVGLATFRSVFPRALVHREPAHRGDAIEKGRIDDARARTRIDLTRLQAEAANEIGEENALVFGAHLLLLDDPMLGKLVERGIANGSPAALAVDLAFDEVLGRLQSVPDAYIHERVEDLEDLRSRVLGHLLDRPSEADIDERVVVSKRTMPSLIVELKARGALGIASELGGTTSHGVLLARALGVPAVTGIHGLTDAVSAGDVIAIDGDEGHVVLRPTPETLAELERRRTAVQRRRAEIARDRERPTVTADGVHYSLQANVALGVDIALAVENRADGIGLYRTEFPFIVRDVLPSVDEQARIYARAYAAFPDGPVVLRLLDLAGDKLFGRHDLGVSRDTFHGYRSIRVLFDHPHIVRDQVQAFTVAAAGRELRILIPMVASVEDVRRMKAIVAPALAQLPATYPRGPLHYGVMIETPAATEIVEDLAREVDFFSIGTNDLVQYALAIDREDPRMASERHAYSPAILRMIHRVVTHAHLAQKHVTVCGEAASRSDLAIALLALDVDALSVSPAFIPELKHALASVPVGPLREAREDLLALSTTDAVTDVLARYAHNVAAPVVTPPPSRRSSSPRSPRTPSMRRWWSRGRSPRSS